MGILVVVQTALTLVFTYSDSSPWRCHPIKMGCRSQYIAARILVVVQTALTLVFTYSDSSPWRCHPIKMGGRLQYIAARILVVVQTSRCSFSHTRIHHRGDAIPLKWNVVTDVGDGYFFAGLCRLRCRLAIIATR